MSSRIRFVGLLSAVVAVAIGSDVRAIDYYWNTTGSINAVASWGTNTDGSGTAPTDFTTASQLFNIQSGQSATLGSAWTISGANSRLVVQTGGTFNGSTFNPTLTATLQSGSTYQAAGSTYGNLTFGTTDANSTFIYAGSAGFRSSVSYGNLTNQSSATLNVSNNFTTQGDLRQSSSSEFRYTSSTNVTATIGRDLLVDSGKILNLSNGAGNSTSNITGTITNSGTISKLTSGTGVATLNFVGSNTSTVTWGTVTATASVNVAAGRDLTFVDTFNSTGTLTLVNSGTIRVGNGGTTGAITPAFTNNGTVVYNRSDAITQGGIIGGTGQLTKESTNALTLDKVNTYSGATAINNGSLLVTGSNAAATTGAYTVNSGGTLGGTGTLATTAGGAVTVNSGGFIRGDSGTGTGTLNVGSVTLNASGGVQAAIGATTVNSKILGTTGTINFVANSKLNLVSSSFSRASAGTWNIASLTDGNNFQIGGAGSQAELAYFGEFIQGTGDVNSRAVLIDATSLSLIGGDKLELQRSGNNLVLTFTPVPEPGTILAVSAGVLGLGAFLRKKFAKASV